MTTVNNFYKENTSYASKPWLAILAIALLLTNINASAAPISLSRTDVLALPTIGNISGANQTLYRGNIEGLFRTDFGPGSGLPGALMPDTLYSIIPIVLVTGSGNINIFTNFSGATFGSDFATIPYSLNIEAQNSDFTIALGFWIWKFIDEVSVIYQPTFSTPLPSNIVDSFISDVDANIGANTTLITDFDSFQSFTINSSASVPEPSALALMSLALAGLGFKRRKITCLSKIN